MDTRYTYDIPGTIYNVTRKRQSSLQICYVVRDALRNEIILG